MVAVIMAVKTVLSPKNKLNEVNFLSKYKIYTYSNYQ